MAPNRCHLFSSALLCRPAKGPNRGHAISSALFCRPRRALIGAMFQRHNAIEDHNTRYTNHFFSNPDNFRDHPFLLGIVHPTYTEVIEQKVEFR